MLAGLGPLTSVAAPPPDCDNPDGAALSAVFVPVFTTSITTVTSCPLTALDGDIVISATRFIAIVGDAVGVLVRVVVKVTVFCGVFVNVIIGDIVQVTVIVAETVVGVYVMVTV
jgi:hypothetical protein